ncbi:hypothetical protein [Paenibacillus xylanexedens]|nr:hypothetical protein [Paenibacillus xylanexedens]
MDGLTRWKGANMTIGLRYGSGKIEAKTGRWPRMIANHDPKPLSAAVAQR